MRRLFSPIKLMVFYLNYLIFFFLIFILTLLGKTYQIILIHPYNAIIILLIKTIIIFMVK